MSTLKINVLTNKTDSGACELTNGATVGAGGQISVSGSVNVTGILTAQSYNATNVNVTGVVTAASFNGNGSGLTNLPTVEAGKMIAYKRIIGFDEYRTL
jgi:hypothetical protein